MSVSFSPPSSSRRLAPDSGALWSLPSRDRGSAPRAGRGVPGAHCQTSSDWERGYRHSQPFLCFAIKAFLKVAFRQLFLSTMGGVGTGLDDAPKKRFPGIPRLFKSKTRNRADGSISTATLGEASTERVNLNDALQPTTYVHRFSAY
jgi:hypothetical protein